MGRELYKERIKKEEASKRKKAKKRGKKGKISQQYRVEKVFKTIKAKREVICAKSQWVEGGRQEMGIVIKTRKKTSTLEGQRLKIAQVPGRRPKTWRKNVRSHKKGNEKEKRDW